MKCSYCNKNIKPGTGTLLITKDAKQLHLCSSKCRKNRKMGRISRRQTWITKKR